MKKQKRPKKFYILSGVRRAVAAREAGQRTIRAVVHQPGTPSIARRVHLNALFSPKAQVELDARFFRILPPITTAIEIEALGEPGQLPIVPLAKVKLV